HFVHLRCTQAEVHLSLRLLRSTRQFCIVDLRGFLPIISQESEALERLEHVHVLRIQSNCTAISFKSLLWAAQALFLNESNALQQLNPCVGVFSMLYLHLKSTHELVRFTRSFVDL